MQKSLMPKGVDHTRPAVCPGVAGFVQKSLMPKGVDHMLVSVSIEHERGAKIFDAERR